MSVSMSSIIEPTLARCGWSASTATVFSAVRVSDPDRFVSPTSALCTSIASMTVVVSLYVARGPPSATSTTWIESQAPSLTNWWPATVFLIKKHPAKPSSRSQR